MLCCCAFWIPARGRVIFSALNLDDVDFVSGAIDIRKGKGGKSWMVFVWQEVVESIARLYPLAG